MQPLVSTDSGGAGLLKPTQALERFQYQLADFAKRSEVRSEMALRHGFRVATLRLLIEERVASEVVEPSGIAPIPRTPPWLMGVMNLRGHPVPVFDLRAALRLPPREGTRAKLVLVLDKGERAVGIEIDEFPTALRGMHRASAVPALPGRLAGSVRAAWVAQNALWLEFEHRVFFEALSGDTGN